MLDTLISLAKSFPSYFLPGKVREAASCGPQSGASKLSAVASTSASTSSQHMTPPAKDTDFWDLLVRLDLATLAGRKGSGSLGKMSSSRSHQGSSAALGSQSGSFSEDDPSSASLASSQGDTSAGASFESSPLGQLVAMLSHPVVKRSSVLTDRLLRLLALIALGLSDLSGSEQSREATGRRPSRSSLSMPTSGGYVPTTQSTAGVTTVAPTSAPERLDGGTHAATTVPTTTTTISRMDMTEVTSDKTDVVQDQASKVSEDPLLEQHLRLAVEVS